MGNRRRPPVCNPDTATDIWQLADRIMLLRSRVGRYAVYDDTSCTGHPVDDDTAVELLQNNNVQKIK